MRIVYLGTPDFAVEPLKKLIEYCNLNNGYQIVGVVTNNDKPVGRKQILTECPVKQFAKLNGLTVFSYDKISKEGVLDIIDLAPDLMITCAFGQILSKEIIDIPKYGIFNIHASLLPKYRGASPIHYAILNGEEKTGVTIMKTELGIDTGDIILKEEIKIEKKETCGQLFERLSIVGANLIIQAINKLVDGTITFEKQNEEFATTTKMIKKSDALIDFNKTNEQVFNQIRAFNPAPIAFFTINGEPYKVYLAELGIGVGQVGEILRADCQLEIACQSGSILVEKIQKSGGKPLEIKDFLRGSKLEKGIIVNK